MILNVTSVVSRTALFKAALFKDPQYILSNTFVDISNSSKLTNHEKVYRAEEFRKKHDLDGILHGT